ncbi:cytochrome C biogenesis protein CcmE [Betaproteobacteria bacterium UKL13-2]|jgi:cytochrome c-type biogenesis protein CcmE|nr:cytochrome C biogenesis protein CcmE [Betaproteobacteria bacterium UKL13-2]HCG53000.1 cytochrome c maturation protein CcmE [Betaproteobacteria bacterium]
MLTLRAKRFVWVAVGVATIAVAVALVLRAFNSNLVFFFTPTEVSQNKAPKDRTFRIGGLVTEGSVQRKPDGLTVAFTVTDTMQSIPVRYTGILPDLFKEGKGVVAQGKIGGDGVFTASEVLAKHDENYMPPEAAEALKRAGHPIEGKVFAGQKPVVTQAGK